MRRRRRQRVAASTVRPAGSPNGSRASGSRWACHQLRRQRKLDDDEDLLRPGDKAQRSSGRRSRSVALGGGDIELVEVGAPAARRVRRNRRARLSLVRWATTSSTSRSTSSRAGSCESTAEASTTDETTAEESGEVSGDGNESSTRARPPRRRAADQTGGPSPAQSWPISRRVRGPERAAPRSPAGSGRPRARSRRRSACSVR